jgi:hypothetical protein
MSNAGSTSAGNPPGQMGRGRPGSGSCILATFSHGSPFVKEFVECYHVPPGVSRRSKTRIRSK